MTICSLQRPSSEYTCIYSTQIVAVVGVVVAQVWQAFEIMGGEDLKLLGTKLSPFSHRIEWALKLKGIEYEFVEEDLEKKSPLLLESNPVYKKVPVLIHGGKCISESLLILEYIEETWSHHPILPGDPIEKAHARFWAKYVDEKLFPVSHKAFYSKGEEQERAIDSLAEGLKFLEGALIEKRGKFYGGRQIGYVDIVVGLIAYWFRFAEEAAGLNIVDSRKYPSFASWINDFLQVAVIQDHLPPPAELRRVCNALQMH